MKQSGFTIVIAVVFCCFCLSCKKEKVQSGGTSLTIINAVVGSKPLVTNFGGTTPVEWYKTAQQISYGSYNAAVNAFRGYSGTVNLALYQYPDTASHDAPLYDLDLNLPGNTIHTLFLTGTVSDPDTLFTRDYPAYHGPLDSTVGIRFVNLSPGSVPISVNIKNNANGSEVSSLPYRGITGFKNYTATSTVNNYIFEFRNAGTGALLTSYTLGNINAANGSVRFRNLTIAVKGLIGGTGAGALGTLLINNY